MNKSELKTGMRVRTRSGDLWLVLKDCDTACYGHQDICFVKKGDFLTGDGYNQDLLRNEFNEYDIIEVCNSLSGGIDSLTLELSLCKPVWERSSSVPQTLADIEKEFSSLLIFLNVCFNY